MLVLATSLLVLTHLSAEAACPEFAEWVAKAKRISTASLFSYSYKTLFP